MTDTLPKQCMTPTGTPAGRARRRQHQGIMAGREEDGNRESSSAPFRMAGPLPLLLVAVVLLAGCTSVEYQSNASAGPAKPVDYPIPIYMEDEAIPRPCQVIGTVSVDAGKFTLFGGSSSKEMTQVMQRAHEVGADVVKFTDLEKPGFTNPNFRMKADLLRYADVWETVGLSEADYEKYLQTHRPTLDPIEGNWISGGPNPHCIGIIKDKSMAGRDFVAFMLRSSNPVWPPGTKKIDIRRGPERGSYVFTYYLDDFAPREVPIHLNQHNAFSFLLEQMDDDNSLISYTRF